MSLYQRLLGLDWFRLDKAVRAAHSIEQHLNRMGLFNISRGKGWIAKCIANIMRLPRSADNVSTRLWITANGDCEVWHRTFDDQSMITVQRESANGLLLERVGIMEFQFKLRVEQGQLIYEQVGMSICIGTLSFPVFAWISPRVHAVEMARGEKMTSVHVEVSAPVAGLILMYEGTVAEEQ